MKHLTTAALLATLASCVSSEPSAELPRRTIEIEPWQLATHFVQVPDAGASAEQQLEYVVEQVRPQIMACLTTVSQPTVIDLELALAVEPDGPATLLSARAAVAPRAAGSLAAIDRSVRPCVDDALLSIDTASLARPARAELWTVHTSLYTEAP